MKNTSSGHGLVRTEKGLRWHLENIERHVFLSKMALMFSLSIFDGENTLFLHLELIFAVSFWEASDPFKW